MPQMSGFKAKMHKIRFLLGSTPNPAVGAYSTPPKPWLYLRGPRPTSKGREGEAGRERKGMGGEGRGQPPPRKYFGQEPPLLQLANLIQLSVQFISRAA